MTTITLPFPVSVNGLYRNVAGRGRVPTKRYQSWKAAAGWEFNIQKPKPVRGPVQISMLVEDKGGRRDLDNLCKCVFDILVERQIIQDDSARYVRSIFLAWSDQVKGCQVTITEAKETAA